MADISVVVTAEQPRLSESITVPTRVYFPAGTIPIDTATIAFDSAWNSTGAAVRRKLVTDGRKRGTAAASITVTSAATNPEKILCAQYVSKPLRKQTLSGNVRGQFRALESNAAFNGTLQIGIRVVSRDGQTVRATLLAVGGSTTTGTTPPEFTTALTNRRLLTSGDVTPLPLTSYDCADGDRLVIEIGLNDKDAGTARTAQISFGDNTVDLLTDDTTTTAQDPWLEFDTTIRFQDAVDTVRISDTGSGVAEMIENNGIKIADGPVLAALITDNNLSRAVADENLKLAESLTVKRDITASVQEDLKLADTLTADRILQVSSTAEALRIADTVTAQLDPLQTTAALTDSLKITDTVTAAFVLLVDKQESIRIAEEAPVGRLDPIIVAVAQESIRIIDDAPPSAVVVVDNILTASLSETLKLSETVTASRDLTASLQEDLKCSETVTAVRQLAVAVADESLRIADTVTGRHDPIVAAPAESLKVVDTVTAERNQALNGTPNSEEPTHLQDSAPVAQLSPLEATVALAEAVRLADGPPTARLDPLLVAATETLKLADTDLTAQRVSTSGVDPEIIRITDTLTASMSAAAGEPGDESLHLRDVVEAGLTPLLGLPAAEQVHTEDRDRTPQLDLAIMPEGLRIGEETVGQRTPQEEILRLADGTVFVQMGDVKNALPAPTEALRLGDVLLQPEMTPYTASLTETVKIGYPTAAAERSEAELTKDEGIRTSDTVSAAITAANGLSTVASETLRLAESITPGRDLAQTVTETARLAETATGVRNLAVSLTEALGIADTPTARRDLSVSVTEALRIADTPIPTLNPLEPSATESLRLTDDVAGVIILDPTDLATAVDAETTRLRTVLDVHVTLAAELTETLRLADLADAGPGTALAVVVAAEALHVADVTDPGIELRDGVDSEDVTIGEELAAVLALTVVVTETVAVEEDLLAVTRDLATVAPGEGEGPTIAALAFTTEDLQADVFTDETLQGEVFTDETLSPV